MNRGDIAYLPIAHRQAVSPVLFSVRRMDRSDELRNVLAII